MGPCLMGIEIVRHSRRADLSIAVLPQMEEVNDTQKNMVCAWVCVCDYLT